jgi:hypothetical protein
MVSRAFETAFETMTKRGWDRIYVFVDLHSTVVRPNYEVGNIPTDFYDHSKEVLQYLSSREDIVLVMYTCSHEHEVKEYYKFFDGNDIKFSYTNVNPEVKTNLKGYGCYDTKPYMNVMIDDKAGFSGEEDWLPLKEYFKL